MENTATKYGMSFNQKINADLLPFLVVALGMTPRFALVKYGGGIIQMSGSIAGTTHARNRSGNYVRARTKPVNPNTDAQANVRAALAFLVERWAETLTAAQRAAWALYASNVTVKNKLGDDIKLSGFNHYIRSNAFHARNGLAPTDAGPVVFEIPEQDPTLAITASEATQQITIAYDDTMDWADETNAGIHFYQGSPQNGQRNFFGGPWRYLAAVGGCTGAPVPDPHVAAIVFGIAEGQHQWIYARIRRADGRISTPFRTDILVAA